MKAVKSLVAFIVCGVLFSTARADQIFAAVASNFTAAMDDIVAQFEAETKHKVIVSYGSSGKFFAQIQNGAPYQVFLSADQSKPEALENVGLIVPGSRFTYASGALALWSSKEGVVDEHYSRLKNGEFNKLALANPKLAPYGAAAIEVLEILKLKQATERKWVQGENIAQTYQFVATGNADMGFVALSQIMEQGQVSRGSTWIIPDRMHSPILQDAVLLKRGQDSLAAKALLDYLRSDKARLIIQNYGYKTD